MEDGEGWEEGRRKRAKRENKVKEKEKGRGAKKH